VADHERLGRLLSETGVGTNPDEPSRLAWFAHWMQLQVERLLEALFGTVEVTGSAGWWAMIAAVSLGAVLTVGLLWMVVSGVRRRFRAEEEPVAAPVDVPVVVPDLAAAEALLDAGHVREATRAAWLWLVARLAAVGIGEPLPDQTHGEYVRTVDRRNPGWPLRPALGELRASADWLCYAPETPTIEGVREFLAKARGLGERVGAA
jgi:hypothetical protein